MSRYPCAAALIVVVAFGTRGDEPKTGDAKQWDVVVRESSLSLKRLVLALHDYEGKYKTLPGAATFDTNGKPLLSWRVMILPFLEQETLYKEFKLDESWDSEHNKKLIAKMPKIFLSSNAKLNADGKTVYLAPVVPVEVNGGSVFAPRKAGRLTLMQISKADGVANTIFIVRANDESAVIWTKPDDLVVDAKEPLKGLKRPRSEPMLVAFGDANVRRLNPNADPKNVVGAFGWNDAYPFDPGDLIVNLRP